MSNRDEQKFIPAFIPTDTSLDKAWILVLAGKRMLVKKTGEKVSIPEKIDLDKLITDYEEAEYLGKYDSHECYCLGLTEMPEDNGDIISIDLMELTERSGDPELFILAGTANHILHWNRINQYCGRCGNKMVRKEGERARTCPICKNIVYPRISPAVITAIFKGDQILLAHNRNFKEGRYSLIAGYVEPGETLEQTVEREIQEEVGIKVKNVRYFRSQPWPFPDALMTAFTAQYESGDITVDNEEITDAGWYNADNLPDIPSTDSVAGKLIRWYRDQHKQ